MRRPDDVPGRRAFPDRGARRPAGPPGGAGWEGGDPPDRRPGAGPGGRGPGRGGPPPRWREPSGAHQDWDRDVDDVDPFADPDLDDDVVYLADGPGLARRPGAVLSFIALFLVVVLGLGGYWVHSQISPTPSGDELTVEIPSDTGIAGIAQVLEDRGVITSATIFRYYARLRGIGPVRAGEYDGLHRGEPMDRVIERLEAGPLPVRFTDLAIPEGLWLTETATRIREQFPQMDDTELVAALNSVRSRYQPAGEPLDGFLFPATYRVTEKQYDDEQALVEQMVGKFDEVAAEVGLADAPGRLAGVAGREQLTPFDVVKVAALVEAEAKVPEDRPRIARVIYNRLKQSMTLDIDAALFNGLGRHKERLTDADKKLDSPFNLYRNRGLTPTPINSPGADSLRAALEPSTEPNAERWLYYVLIDKEGHHSFSQTLAEHQRKVAEARRAGVL